MKSQTLFEITREHLMVLQLIEENEGVVDVETEKALSLNRESFRNKSLNYVQLIRFCESEIERAKEAEKQILVFKNRKQVVIDQLMDKLENAVKIFGPIETGFVKLSLRRSERVMVDDLSLVPLQYQIEKVSKVLDKSKIKADIKMGKEVPGASIQTNHNLQIK